MTEELTEETSTTSHLSVAMTTAVTSTSSRGTEFYFQCAVMVIGVVGTAANALILYALVASKQHKKHVLIVNQNALDLFSCFSVIITYPLRLCNIYLTGPVGYWLCAVLLSDSLVWSGTVGSVVNLAIITIDRYLKVVHPLWSKKVSIWMIYSAMAFAWIIGITSNLAAVFPTSVVMDGICYPFVTWENETARIFHFIWHFVSFYAVIILIFIFCYWRILMVIRRQASVMAGHGAPGSSAAQAQSHQIQTNVIKTMILVSAFYAISWFPSYTYMLLFTLNPSLVTNLDGFYYVSIFMTFLYMCTNPFIYATKFNPVKEILLRMISCKKTSEQATANVANVAVGHATPRAVHHS